MRKTLFFLSISIGFISLIRAQTVNIPDSNFKAYLLANSNINTNGDGEIQVSEAQAYTETIDCSSKNITDLTGIEAFINIKTLRCFNNKLKDLDLSKNTALTVLHCYNNQLKNLNVNQNTALTSLMCFTNELTSLEVNKSVSLKYLYCGTNQLKNLDVSKNISLLILECGHNQLTNIDVSKNKMLQSIQCNSNQLTNLNLKNGNNEAISTMYAFDNPDLGCIQIDDIASIDWQKDTNAGYSTNCLLSVNNVNQKKLALYPNPVKNILNASEDISDIKIIDNSARVVKEFSGNSRTFDISNLPKGNYVVIVHTKTGEIINQKIIKE